MRKLSVLTTLSLSAVLLMGCSQMRRNPTPAPTTDDYSAMTETVDMEDEVSRLSAKSEDTHVIAEASAEDREIKEQAGSSDIDADLGGSDSSKIPYSRDFLLKKNTNRMQFWVDYFTKQQRDRFQRFINNGEEYRHHIEKIFQSHGLPKELYFVGLIESGYYLGARSHASAVGPWQFIRGTGSRYGLKISSELDERQDLFKATHAAAAYFKDLHNIFSSWELALSAYNAGEYGIIRRIMKHGTRDFYELSRNKQLPTETINYVPKVLAAMHVINNAAKYGFVLPRKSHRLFDKTKLLSVRKNEPLKSIASKVGTSARILRKLNPELKRNATPRYFSGTYRIRVPASHNTYIYEEAADVRAAASVSNDSESSVAPITFHKPESRRELTKRVAAAPKYHRVKRGDTLISISRKYEKTPKELAVLNNFASWKTKVRVGQRLMLEEQEVNVRQASVRATNSPIVYKVARGDNLTDLARLFNSTLAKIKTANKLRRGSIQVGQKIILPGTQKGIYTVRQGDKLAKVAREFNQPIEALVKINSLKQRSIRVGQKLIVNID